MQFFSFVRKSLDEHFSSFSRKKLTIEEETFCSCYKRAQHIKWGEIAVLTPTHVATEGNEKKSTAFNECQILTSHPDFFFSSVNFKILESHLYLWSDYWPLLLFSQLKTWLLLNLKLGEICEESSHVCSVWAGLKETSEFSFRRRLKNAWKQN